MIYLGKWHFSPGTSVLDLAHMLTKQFHRTLASTQKGFITNAGTLCWRWIS